MLLDIKGVAPLHRYPWVKNNSRLPEFMSIPKDDKFASSRAFSREDTMDPAILNESVDLATKYMPRYSW